MANTGNVSYLHFICCKELNLPVFNRFHVFRAFKSSTAPNTNMAEVGHSRNATRGAKNDTLARVAEDYIVESALLKAKLDRYGEIVVKSIYLIHSFWVIFFFENNYQLYISFPIDSQPRLTFTRNYNKLLVIPPSPISLVIGLTHLSSNYSYVM